MTARPPQLTQTERRALQLTPAERQMLLLMIEGLGTADIAAHLVIQPSTVKTHRRNLYRKSDTHEAVALVAWGRRWFQAERIAANRAQHA